VTVEVNYRPRSPSDFPAHPLFFFKSGERSSLLYHSSLNLNLKKVPNPEELDSGFYTPILLLESPDYSFQLPAPPSTFLLPATNARGKPFRHLRFDSHAIAEVSPQTIVPSVAFLRSRPFSVPISFNSPNFWSIEAPHNNFFPSFVESFSFQACSFPSAARHCFTS